MFRLLEGRRRRSRDAYLADDGLQKRRPEIRENKVTSRQPCYRGKNDDRRYWEQTEQSFR